MEPMEPMVRQDLQVPQERMVLMGQLVLLV
jgi:hypothetical protein